MAGTIVLGSFDNGRVTFECDHDDNMDIITFRCNNSSEADAFGSLSKVDSQGLIVQSAQFGLTAPAGAITTIIIPQGVNGIRLSPASKPGQFDGYSASLRFPF